MTRKISAYLSIYNDWDILPAALRSVAPYFDELVVIDGAYEWMIPYLNVLGLAPERSDPRVYDAIASCGMPFRVISRTWKNEVEKRKFGYTACAHQYVCRIDADEVLFFNENVFDAALSSGLSVGEMEMPNYVAPGWISCARDLPGFERQCFLFNKEQVSSDIHLNYLWLILTADTLPLAGERPFGVYPEPLAFNAHLTNWRTPETSAHRAAFYTLNWMRRNGIPWIPHLRGKPLTDVRRLFDVIKPATFLSFLSKGQMALGATESPSERKFAPSPLSANQESTFTFIYDNFLRSLIAANAAAFAAEQSFLLGLPFFLDLSTPEARAAIAPNGTVSLDLSVPPSAAKIRLITYFAHDPGQEALELPVIASDRKLEFVLPNNPASVHPMLRQFLEVQIWSAAPNLTQHFRVMI